MEDDDDKDEDTYSLEVNDDDGNDEGPEVSEYQMNYSLLNELFQGFQLSGSNELLQPSTTSFSSIPRLWH